MNAMVTVTYRLNAKQRIYRIRNLIILFH